VIVVRRTFLGSPDWWDVEIDLQGEIAGEEEFGVLAGIEVRNAGLIGLQRVWVQGVEMRRDRRAA